jgi:hypothetical protein
MGKGLRSSVKKTNRSKLRASVFGPVESERAERIHAKLLETIQQPKPELPKKAAMDVDSEGKPESESPASVHKSTEPRSPDAAATEDTSKDDLPKGSCILNAKIPSYLSSEDVTAPSPKDECYMRNLCFYLGLSSDIVGFNTHGELEFAFDPLPRHRLSDQGLTAIS